MTIDARIAAFASGHANARLAPALASRLRAKARLCLIDGVGASMTLTRSREARQALASVGAPPGVRGSGALVLGTGTLHRAQDSAFVNAVAAASTIRTDTHAASASHPGMVVLPVLLALAQTRRIGMEDLLDAIVVGYEVSIRLGITLVTPELARRFRPTGLTGAIGAAAAACRLLRLDRSTTGHALSLAANTVAGLNEWARAGTPEHVFHAGAAARNAMVAVDLACAGAVAASLTLSGESGLFAAYAASERAARMTDGLGDLFPTLEVVHKRVPACVFAQAPCEAALALLRGQAIDTDAVVAVEIGVARAAAEFPGCDFTGPFDSPSAAQQSIQFGVASVLHDAGLDEALWAHPEVPALAELAARCRLVEDPVLESAYPSQLGACVAVVLRDGRRLTARVAEAAPMSVEEIEARHLDDTTACLGAPAAVRLLNVLRTASGDLTPLFDLLAFEPATPNATCLDPKTHT